MSLTRGMFILFTFIWCANYVYAQVDIPVNTVHVTDDLDSYENLVGGVDQDHGLRELVIRWNFGRIELFDVHIYLEDLNDRTQRYYLGRTGDGNATYFEWSKVAENINPKYSWGPDFKGSYRFLVVGLIQKDHGRIWLRANDNVTLISMTVLTPRPSPSLTPTPTITPTNNISNQYPPTETPTSTPIPKLTIIDVPNNKLIITDDLFSTIDLSGKWDFDNQNSREIVFHWQSRLKYNDNILVYISDDYGTYFLTQVNNLEQSWYKWSPDSVSFSHQLAGGPQFGKQYRVVITFNKMKLQSSDVHTSETLYGRFMLLRENDPTPTNTPTNTRRPTYTPTSTRTPFLTPTPEQLQPLFYPFEVKEIQNDSLEEIEIQLPALNANDIPLTLVKIPHGTFEMGSELDENDTRNIFREPQKKINIDHDFYIGKYEVTYEQYKSFRRTYDPKNQVYENSNNLPISNINWYEAKAFCEWLNINTSGWKFRLPSEAEWEFCARAGTTTRRYWGNDTENEMLCMFANVGDKSVGVEYDYSAHQGRILWEHHPPFEHCIDGFRSLASVGSYTPNDYGLFDVFGNVYEWCEDDWQDDYTNVPNDGTPYYHPSVVSHKVLKGGSSSRYSYYIDVKASGGLHAFSSYRFPPKGMVNTGGSYSPFFEFGFRIVAERDPSYVLEDIPKVYEFSGNPPKELIIDLPSIDDDEETHLQLAWIPPGTFMMGSPTNEVGRNVNEGPIHEVTISKGFYMGKFEITNAQMRLILPNYESTFYDSAHYTELLKLNVDNHPANFVTYETVDTYLNRLNLLIDGLHFRLPTEAEWEYAARGGTTTRKYWGDDFDEKLACLYENVADESTSEINFPVFFTCNDGFPGLSPVGIYLPNPFGLYDMLGNVPELCSDRYASYPGNPVKVPNNSVSNERRVVRGGGAFNIKNSIRSSYRARSGSYEGFRVVAEIEPITKKNILPIQTHTPTITPTHTPYPNHTPTPTPH